MTPRRKTASGKDTPKKRERSNGLPSREQILEFISSATGPVGKREIARAFGIKGADRIPLKQMLKEMAEEGLLAKREGRRLHRAGELPPVTVIEITHSDTDGELIARPVDWTGEGAAPEIVITPEPHKGRIGERDAEPPAGVGDRLLARLTRTTEEGEVYAYEARIIRRVGKGAEQVLGLFRETSEGGRLVPVDKRVRNESEIARADTGGAKDGDLVLAEIVPGKRYGLSRARVREVFGRSDDPKSISLIAIHAHGIPDKFPDSVLGEAEAARPHGIEGRTDLRDIPLVTIDPEDARDHDDAVWAGPDPDPVNEGGHVVIVAIADVAAYVRLGSPMDREARKRGNSTYFPDRVVPMLPERISNDLCSLREKEDRACFAVRMVFDANGNKRRHEFIRGFMRSAARLSYRQVQQAIDGAPDDKTGPILEPVLRPLWDAYKTISIAREKRGPLDLDLPEYKARLDERGRIAAIRIADKFESMKLIEEFMIQANVCAAETAEQRQTSLIYRIHDAPSREKLVALSEFLQTLNLSFPKGQVVRPTNFNRILAEVDGTEFDQMVSSIILRSQAQAVYSPDNIGHFGLNLRRYAHFTSPIRRYADLVVHRALIAALRFGADGQSADEAGSLAEIAEHISEMERRSMLAERDSMDRFIAAFLEARIGAEFPGRISGVTRFGLFVRLDETGADGIVPISNLGTEFFHHDEAGHALIGERSGLTFRLGERVSVRLEEAVPVTGGLRFEIVEGGTEGKPAGRHGAAYGKGRGKAPRRAAAKPGKKPAQKSRKSAKLRAGQKPAVKRAKQPHTD
ncbi:MAG: ribonuclease R [Parvibaculum sp.]|uniref:ribonuclease R n=1 Tax=Parvibaculum sp. TaxID=2024848 RepID=UPI003C7156B3